MSAPSAWRRSRERAESVPSLRSFCKRPAKLCNSTGALLVLDEIQCGLGRTGRYFAYQHYGIKPDIVTIAKPLAGGLPLGAILTTNRVANSMHPGMHGTTFGGGPLACAVAVTFLDVLDDLLGHVREAGSYFREQLEGLKSRHECIREIRGMGLMLGMELDSADKAKEVVSALLQNRILINRTHETVLRFLPPYIIQDKHIDQLIRALDSALSGGTAKAGKSAAPRKGHKKSIKRSQE